MPGLDTYRKQAKRLVRWHRDGNYSVGEMVRLLDRYRDLTDGEVLAMDFPLTLAQEIIAVEAGYGSWSELRAHAAPDVRDARRTELRTEAETETSLAIRPAVPILFVRDVATAAAWYGRIGFATDFVHGRPPFYASVSRGEASLHLRFVSRPNFAELAATERSLILVTIEVTDVRSLFDEVEATGVDLAQRLTRQIWGGLDFHVRDPDGNVISFVEYD